MRFKEVQLVQSKAEGDAGEFSAIVSAFGNVDRAGDRMLPGSFSRTLKDWRGSGDPIPIVLSHQWNDPMAHVGSADPNEVRETAEGLVVRGKLDLSENPIAKQTYKLLKERRLKGWSFGYTVPTGGERMRDGVNEVSEVDLIEVGPTLVGANPAARTLAVKSLDETPDRFRIGGARQKLAAAPVRVAEFAVE